MTTLFLICAVAGGTLLVCQLVMMLLGFGNHHDVAADHGGDLSHDLHSGGGDHQASAFWSLLSIRALVPAVTIFGLAGMAGQKANLPAPLTLGIALAVAVVLASAITWLMRSIYRLQDDGTARIEQARGATGTVYVSIPGESKGPGKVQLELQNRLIEFQAVTPKSALETGTRIVVVDVVDPETVEVIAVPQRSAV
jgi:membrane protein implicated in regulation of membrane protease activity